MAKTLIMTATALMVLAAILWMWRVEAQSSHRVPSSPSLTALEPTSPPAEQENPRDGQENIAPSAPEEGSPTDWPENIAPPARLVIPRNSSLSELVELYYNSYEAGGISWPVAGKFKKALVGRLASENGIQDSDAVLPAGTSISLPRIYIVRDGDNLTRIAKAVYGDGTRWKEIHKANKGLIQDYNRLKTGWVLIIP